MAGYKVEWTKDFTSLAVIMQLPEVLNFAFEVNSNIQFVDNDELVRYAAIFVDDKIEYPGDRIATVFVLIFGGVAWVTSFGICSLLTDSIIGSAIVSLCVGLFSGERALLFLKNQTIQPNQDKE